MFISVVIIGVTLIIVDDFITTIVANHASPSPGIVMHRYTPSPCSPFCFLAVCRHRVVHVIAMDEAVSFVVEEPLDSRPRRTTGSSGGPTPRVVEVLVVVAPGPLPGAGKSGSVDRHASGSSGGKQEAQ